MSLFAAWVVLLAFPLPATAAERLYLSRTFELDFRAPGKITLLDSTGLAPVSEEIRKNSYVLILPKRIDLILSITNDNEDEHHYHIGVKIKDELAPVQKQDGFVLPGDITKMFWLDAYRYQITMVRKEASGKGNFVAATIKLDVFAPAPKTKPPAK